MQNPKLPKRAIWLLVVLASLFLPAGTLAWPQGWAFFVEFYGGLIIVMRWLKRHDPALYEERNRTTWRENWPRSDRIIGQAMGLSWYAWIVFMAFDYRWQLSPVPLVLCVAGAVIMPIGGLMVARTLKTNSFAAAAVRLQPERGQVVIDSGPYAVVRHPMYSAAIITYIGTALLLGSWIGLALVPALTALLVVRIVLEERLLRGGLAGYTDYCSRVRWRLVPGLW